MERIRIICWFGERSSLFLRFNPDKYVTESGEKIPSCWKYNAKGLTVIKDEQAWNLRLQTLKKYVEYYLINVPEKLIQIEELFFNELRSEDNDDNED
jgi:hypothetical protein